ncbi:methyltransferase domain-containing [Plasmopara halstedii]|uniref:tRNA N(3)-methylcytidine methyltransferase n=1 Tax=Plasmopara halstedii TaxID=4781 RepID=A0A0P1AJ61_PLAHL|nr:methyltransferase domain-containing [Plasmopara halstedii]CEG40831.1 methyltransferase domain-containing [Plasmopara halstedii]|eukprot:XP_024577200.1 methyltransferase domain-containing [Plasmopara halstedii]
MSGIEKPTNQKLEELVDRAGVGKLVLEDPNCVVCDDVWTEERERLARELLSQDTSTIPEFWQNKYEKESAKSWDKFYKRNSTNFYKDRHYLHLVFKDLSVVPEGGETRTLLEIGSGVGNAALPLLKINPALHIVAIDFADSAIDLLKKQPLYDQNRVSASVCDITKDPLPDAAFENGGVNYALFMFCLSALHPDKMKAAVMKVVAAIKPGGKLFFRDYGRYDQAQLRFRSGCKLQDNFYVRQDNTRAYYFTTEEIKEIFTAAGLCMVENEYIRRQYANRQQNVVRFRVWVHAIFEKPQ